MTTNHTPRTLWEKDDLPECVKVRGVKWKPAEDVLVCDIGDLYKVAITMHPTKRNVIGLSARMYDPMGILHLGQYASSYFSRIFVQQD